MQTYIDAILSQITDQTKEGLIAEYFVKNELRNNPYFQQKCYIEDPTNWVIGKNTKGFLCAINFRFKGQVPSESFRKFLKDVGIVYIYDIELERVDEKPIEDTFYFGKEGYKYRANMFYNGFRKYAPDFFANFVCGQMEEKPPNKNPIALDYVKDFKKLNPLDEEWYKFCVMDEAKSTLFFRYFEDAMDIDFLCYNENKVKLFEIKSKTKHSHFQINIGEYNHYKNLLEMSFRSDVKLDIYVACMCHDTIQEKEHFVRNVLNQKEVESRFLTKKMDIPWMESAFEVNSTKRFEWDTFTNEDLYWQRQIPKMKETVEKMEVFQTPQMQRLLEELYLRIGKELDLYYFLDSVIYEKKLVYKGYQIVPVLKNKERSWNLLVEEELFEQMKTKKIVVAFLEKYEENGKKCFDFLGFSSFPYIENNFYFKPGNIAFGQTNFFRLENYYNQKERQNFDEFANNKLTKVLPNQKQSPIYFYRIKEKTDDGDELYIEDLINKVLRPIEELVVN